MLVKHLDLPFKDISFLFSWSAIVMPLFYPSKTLTVHIKINMVYVGCKYAFEDCRFCNNAYLSWMGDQGISCQVM